MKINYGKIKGKAIVVRNNINLDELVLAFIYDGKLPITREHVHGGDRLLYSAWCNFGRKIDEKYREVGDSFAIVLDSNTSEGCVYGDAESLKDLGYELISINDALEELPNMCNILGVSPDKSLEEVGLMEEDRFSPHYITLDGVIRANNHGVLVVSEVIELLKKVDCIGDEYNKLYDLFNLKSGDIFTLDGYTYDGFSADEFNSFVYECELNTGLIYDVINNPDIVKVAVDLDYEPARRR